MLLVSSKHQRSETRKDEGDEDSQLLLCRFLDIEDMRYSYRNPKLCMTRMSRA